MSFNKQLAMNCTFQDFLNLGFIKVEDGTGDHRGTTYIFENDNFKISIDAWFEVSLSRKNPDTDEINIVCDDLYELGVIIDFIKYK